MKMLSYMMMGVMIIESYGAKFNKGDNATVMRPNPQILEQALAKVDPSSRSTVELILNDTNGQNVIIEGKIENGTLDNFGWYQFKWGSKTVSVPECCLEEVKGVATETKDVHVEVENIHVEVARFKVGDKVRVATLGDDKARVGDKVKWTQEAALCKQYNLQGKEVTITKVLPHGRYNIKYKHETFLWSIPGSHLVESAFPEHADLFLAGFADEDEASIRIKNIKNGNPVEYVIELTESREERTVTREQIITRDRFTMQHVFNDEVVEDWEPTLGEKVIVSKKDDTKHGVEGIIEKVIMNYYYTREFSVRFPDDTVLTYLGEDLKAASTQSDVAKRLRRLLE